VTTNIVILLFFGWVPIGLWLEELGLHEMVALLIAVPLFYVSEGALFLLTLEVIKCKTKERKPQSL